MMDEEYDWIRECTFRSVQCDFDVDVVQRGSTCGHWYMKVSTGNAVLIPTGNSNDSNDKNNCNSSKGHF